METLDQAHLEIRSRICDAFLVAVSILAIPTLAVDLYRALDIGWQPVMAMHIPFVIALWSITLSRRHLPYRVRVVFLLSFFSIIGLADVWTFGLVSAATSFLVITPLLGTIFFGMRSGLIILAVVILMSGMIGMLTVLEHRLPPFDLAIYIVSPPAWGVAILVWGIAGGAVAIAIGVLNKFLIKTLEKSRQAEGSLRKSEESLITAQRIAKLGNWDWNVETGGLWWSDEIYRIFGLKEREFEPTYEAFLKRVYPYDRAKLESAVGMALDGKPYDIEHRIVLPSGEERIVHERGEVTFDDDAKPVRMLGTVMDITKLKCAEEASRKLSQAVEQSSSIVVITDTKGVIEYVNPKFVETTGYSAEEALGQNPRLMKSGHTSPGEYEEMWKTITAGGEWHGEFHNKHKDGTLYWESASISSIKEKDGTITNFLAIKDDITDRKRVEEELRSKSKSVELLEKIAVAANEASDVNEALQTCLDLVCDHTSWPVGHVYVFSKDEGDLYPTDIWHLDNPEPFTTFRKVTEESRFAPGVGLPGRVLSSGKPVWVVDVTEDPRFLRAKLAKDIGVKAGLMFPVLVGDEVSAVLEFFSDEAVAPVPELLEVMAHVGTQLGRVVERAQANEEIVTAKVTAERANSTKSEFLANMSHELRTPLNAIIGFSEMMEGEMFGPLQSNYLEYASDIKGSGEHLLGIISDILDLSKVEAGELDIQEEELDLADLLASCQLMVNERAQKAGVTVTFEVANDLPAIYADPLRMKQILLNLLNNAIKFTPMEGQVTLTCEIKKDGDVGLTVSDTGVGIADEDIPKVLQKFGQVRDGHTHAHEGSGLGLAIANALTELHGGTLAIESEIAKGTTVAVTIPRDRTAPTRQMAGFAQITTTQNH